MRKSRVWKVVLAFFIAPCLGYKPTISAQTPGDLSLSISLAGESEQCLPLLPVAVELELRNDRGATQTIVGTGLGVVESMFQDSPARYLVRIERPQGKSKAVHLCDWLNWLIDAPGMANPAQYLAPGHRQIVEYSIGYGVPDGSAPEPEYGQRTRNATPVFDGVGEYRVQMVLARFNPPLESNILRITIETPQRPGDIAAYDILSHSPWPWILLSPPVTFETKRGSWGEGTPHLPEVRAVGTTSPLDTCRAILERCPGSPYAAHARLFLGAALCAGWSEVLAGAPVDTKDWDKDVEGVRLLRQAAGDIALAQRHREQALVVLREEAQALTSRIQSQGLETAPTLERLLGVETIDVGVPPEFVLRMVYDVSQGTAPPGYSELLNAKLTPQQIETIRTALATNESLAQAARVTPLQLELEGYTKWAREELCKLPWRDPLTGDLTMAGRPLPGP